MSGSSSVVPVITDVSPTDWSYTEVRKRRSGMGQYTLIETFQGSKTAPRAQFPRMRSPFGASVPFQVAKDIERGAHVEVDRYTLDCDVIDRDLVDWCETFDEFNRQYCLANKTAIFKNSESINESSIVHFYRPTITASKDPKWSPKIRFKITSDTRLYRYNSRTDSTSRIPFSDASNIKSGDEVLPIAYITGLWLQPKEAGVTLNLSDVVWFPSTTMEERYDFNPIGFPTGKLPSLETDDLEEDIEMETTSTGSS